MLKTLRPLINSWLARRIAAALTAAAAVVGTSEEDTRGASAFVTAVAVFLFDCLQAWIRRKFLPPAPATPPVL
ncbi:MAG: hypothetical protein V4726_00930 [Verrucomicrobiota bacterium]